MLSSFLLLVASITDVCCVTVVGFVPAVACFPVVAGILAIAGTPVIGCAANILFEANRKQIFIHFEPNNAGFIRLFNIKANQQILHAKQIKRERFYLFRFKATNLKRRK